MADVGEVFCDFSGGLAYLCPGFLNPKELQRAPKTQGVAERLAEGLEDGRGTD